MENKECQGNNQGQINNFAIALRMREFEITQLTTRNNFFMIFQGVLFAGVVQSPHSKPIVSMMVCVAGLAVALYQVGMASGAKFWQEYWEEMLSEFEGVARAADPELFHDNTCQYEKVVKGRLHARGITGFTGDLIMRRFSVSRIPIYVGIVLSVIWGLLVLSAFRGYPPLAIPSFVVGF